MKKQLSLRVMRRIQKMSPTQVKVALIRAKLQILNARMLSRKISDELGYRRQQVSQMKHARESSD